MNFSDAVNPNPPNTIYIIASNVCGFNFLSKNNSAINPVASSKKARKVITLLLLGLLSPSPESVLIKKLNGKAFFLEIIVLLLNIHRKSLKRRISNLYLSFI